MFLTCHGVERMVKRKPFFRAPVVVLWILALSLPAVALAQRTKLKPGWNLFSTQQDVEMGRQVSADAESKLALLNDRRVDGYLNRLGRRLAAKAPGAKYPYQFKAVNDKAINAFALPGGFLYVNRGVFEAAENESQLAGVMAHEIGHVAMRHGTNQASKAYLAQAPLAILGGVLGNNSVGAVLAQVGAGFAVNSVLLKYSRTAERQADILGTQILFDNQYDPRAMAQFFEILEGQSKGKGPPEFFSSHPKPKNRIVRVNEEISRLGGEPRDMQTDSREFREIKRYVHSLPDPPKGGTKGDARSEDRENRPERPAPPSKFYRTYENDLFRIRYPENWRATGQGTSATIAPEGGALDNGLTYGVLAAVFDLSRSATRDPTLAEATDQLIQTLRQSNRNLRITRRSRRTRIGRRRALSTVLENESPFGGGESDWLVTFLHPRGLIYFICVAPEQDFDGYQRTFQAMLNSIRLVR